MKMSDIYDLPIVFDPDWPRDATGRIVHVSSGDAIHAVNCHDDLVEALKSARETILELVNSRWSESEGSDVEWTKDIDAVLLKAEASS